MVRGCISVTKSGHDIESWPVPKRGNTVSVPNVLLRNRKRILRELSGFGRESCCIDSGAPKPSEDWRSGKEDNINQKTTVYIIYIVGVFRYSLYTTFTDIAQHFGDIQLQRRNQILESSNHSRKCKFDQV
jgi:hypothetical protein